MRFQLLLILLIALAGVVIALLIPSPLAYYSAPDDPGVFGEADSVITSGDIRCEIIEKNGGADAPAGDARILPGGVIPETVTVKNTGDHPFWLRVRIRSAVDDESLPADVLEFDLNSADWIDGNDGYCYYRKPVAPGTETEHLFTRVKVAESVGNAYLGKTVKLTVRAYAVQSEYNDAASPLSVSGWPAERGGGV